eukprot:scaffold686_cov292-Chaetoceros_neogracile.AAC.1
MEKICLHRFGRNYRTKVEEERTNLQNIRDVIQKAWDTEIKCYEMGLKQEVIHPSLLTNLSQRIFPYHKSCYLLLDMYLCVEGEFLYKMPFCISEYARRSDGVILEEGYLPNSAYAIWSSLIPTYRARRTSEALSEAERSLRIGYENMTRDPSDTIWVPSHEDFLFLTKWAIDSEHHVTKFYYGLPLFETLPKGQRTKILLKLLKHSTSKLQRDHRLGRA